ncbi:hypothetical protein BGZ51_008283, partial [Haplosporangium sp. Z 767]
MAANTLTLFCVISGELASNVFSVKISSDKTVGHLKNAIREKNPNKFRHIAANNLVLWRAAIPIDENAGDESIITLDGLDDKTKLGNPRTCLSKVFPEEPLEETVSIIIQQPPPPVPKREREEDAVPSLKTYLDTNPLKDAIEKAGLTDKAVVNDQSDLSLLDSKERVSVLRFLGSSVENSSSFVSLFRTALAFRNSSFQDIEKLSTPSYPRAAFPVVETKDLYVRQAYKDLYDEVSFKFQNSPRNRHQERVVVTGTSGIGKSAFLVYFTIRLLATGSDDNPSIV